MYVPDHFRPTDADVRELLAHLDAADLITATEDGLLATFLPLIHEPPGASPEAGDHGRLMGHVARNNRQWKTPPIGEALVIVRGPEAYISPAWYATKREHGRVVPTWNYVTAHVHGQLVVHDDRDWVEANVRALVERHEAGRPDPWSVDDAPREYVEGQLRAIVGAGGPDHPDRGEAEAQPEPLGGRRRRRDRGTQRGGRRALAGDGRGDAGGRSGT